MQPPAAPGKTLDWTVPKGAAAAALVFLAVNLAALAGLRGVADPEGFILNTSHIVPVNSHEDDGQINIAAMLGFLEPGSSKFGYYFNIGGPFLHIASGAAAAADALGLVKRFDQPALYWLYPEELKRAWTFFGAVKLCFVVWLPVAAYWFGNNHLSRRAGLIGAWLVCAMPFLPGFEQRMKVDSVAILAGLVSLTLALAYARWGGRSRMVMAASTLAVSLSMKFVMLPAAPVVLACALAGWRAEGGRFFSRRFLAWISGTGLLALAVFFLANPRFIPGLILLARDYGTSMSSFHAAPVKYGLAEALLARLTSLGTLAGRWMDWAAIPVLFLTALACLAGRRPWRAGAAALAAFFVLDVAFVFVFAGVGMALEYTYYFFAAALAACMMTAFILDRLAAGATRLGTLPALAALLLPLALAAWSFGEQARVLEYVTSPTNRQQALEWLSANVPPGATVAVPLPPAGSPLNTLYWVDPFRYRVVPAGKALELAGGLEPAFVLRVLDGKAGQSELPPGYEQAAVFERGEGLSGSGRRDMFQDEAYQVLRRLGAGPPDQADTPEHRIFQFAEADPEPVFNLMTWKSTSLYPISLEMFRKWDDRVTPFPIRAFASSIREGGVLNYVHQIPPECLTLWGVKYLLAPGPDGGALRTEPLASGRYPLTPAGWAGAGKDGPSLYRNTGYLGQAMFIPRSAPLDTRQASPSPFFPGRGRLPLYGDLATAAGPDGPSIVEVSFALETDQPVDMILSDGHSKQSVVAGPGYHATSLPFRLGPKGVRYEINPVSAPARVILHHIEVRPMDLVGPPTVQAADPSPRRATARVDVPASGRVVFALPWHRYWQAEVDGKPARALRGPGNTVAVEVPQGASQAAIRIK
ncbi:MAG: hypothetical protein ACOZEN_04665 [Thermodesulfobacteriota bacterium]